MFARGKSNLLAEIEDRRSVLSEMIERFPNLIKDEIANFEMLMDKEAKEAAESDIDIEISCRANSMYYSVIDYKYDVLTCHYYSLCLMIYAYAESLVTRISLEVNPIKKKLKGNYLEGHYQRIKSKYPRLPKLKAIWNDKDSIQKNRNMIAHQLKSQDVTITQEYLTRNLESAYNLLCTIEKEINRTT